MNRLKSLHCLYIARLADDCKNGQKLKPHQITVQEMITLSNNDGHIHSGVIIHTETIKTCKENGSQPLSARISLQDSGLQDWKQ